MSAVPPVIRPYRQQDLGRVVRLWEERGLVPEGPDGLTVDQALDVMMAGDAVTLVAERGDRLCGAAVGTVSGPLGWVFRIAASGPDEDEITERLLDHLEGTLSERGARRIAVGVRDGDALEGRLRDRDYRRSDGVSLLIRDLPSTVAGPKALSQLGGRMIDRDLWEQLRAWRRSSGSSSAE